MEFVCPQYIQDLFNDEETAGEGRVRAADWAASLSLHEDDMVWLPEIGWHMRGSYIQ